LASQTRRLESQTKNISTVTEPNTKRLERRMPATWSYRETRSEPAC
jgi:hypothetical protein